LKVVKERVSADLEEASSNILKR